MTPLVAPLVPRATDTLVPIGHVDYTNTPIILIAVLLAITWTLVGLRTFTRGFLLRSCGWDDGFMIIALIFFSVFQIAWLITHLMLNGKSAIPLHELKTSISWLLTSELCCVIALVFVKISLGAFFLRLLASPWQRQIVYAAIVVSTIYNVGYFFFIIFQCGMFSSAFDLFQKEGRGECLTREQVLAVAYTQGAISTLTDWIFAILPITLVNKSRLEMREKVVVVLIIAMGAMGSLASVVRFIYISRVVSAGQFYSDLISLAVWSSLEVALGIAAGCLVTMRPLFRKFVLGLRNVCPPENSQKSKSSGHGSERASTSRPPYCNCTPPTLGAPQSTDKLHEADGGACLPTSPSTVEDSAQSWSGKSWRESVPLSPLSSPRNSAAQTPWNDPLPSTMRRPSTAGERTLGSDPSPPLPATTRRPSTAGAQTPWKESMPPTTRRPSTAGSGMQGRRKGSIASQLQAVPIPTVELSPRGPINFDARGMPVPD